MRKVPKSNLLANLFLLIKKGKVKTWPQRRGGAHVEDLHTWCWFGLTVQWEIKQIEMKIFKQIMNEHFWLGYFYLSFPKCFVIRSTSSLSTSQLLLLLLQVAVGALLHQGLQVVGVLLHPWEQVVQDVGGVAVLVHLQQHNQIKLGLSTPSLRSQEHMFGFLDLDTMDLLN